MKFKIKLPKDAHYLLYTSLYSQIHCLRLKKKNLESGFCLAQPSSSHKLEMPLYSREASWINQISGCGRLWLLLLLALHPSLSRSAEPQPAVSLPCPPFLGPALWLQQTGIVEIGTCPDSSVAFLGMLTPSLLGWSKDAFLFLQAMSKDAYRCWPIAGHSLGPCDRGQLAGKCSLQKAENKDGQKPVWWSYL